MWTLVNNGVAVFSMPKAAVLKASCSTTSSIIAGTCASICGSTTFPSPDSTGRLPMKGESGWRQSPPDPIPDGAFRVSDPEPSSPSLPSSHLHSVGTQVVVLRETLGQGRRTLHPHGGGRGCDSDSRRPRSSVPGPLSGRRRRRRSPGRISWHSRSTRRDASARMRPSLPRPELFDRVLFRCVIGSRAAWSGRRRLGHGHHGIFLPAADQHWSLFGIPETARETGDPGALLGAAAVPRPGVKANPNVLECLYSPLVEKATPLARELLAMRDAFLSRLVYQTYNGYVMSQFKKMQADLRNQGTVKWKHVMHLIRLLLAGIHVLREGPSRCGRTPHRDRLRAIKRGEVPWRRPRNGGSISIRSSTGPTRKPGSPTGPTTTAPDRFLRKARRLAIEEALP